MIADPSLIPFTNSAEDVIFFFYIFARFSGLFLISPLFSNNLTPIRARIFLTVFMTIIVGLTLWQDYRLPDSIFVLPELQPDAPLSLITITLSSLKELAIGYLVGFAFSILYEATLLAGQLIGILVGLSITELLDPMTNRPQGLVGQLLSTLATLLILTLDLHHNFIQVTVDSFSILPLGQYSLSQEFVQDFYSGTGRLFDHGIQIAAIPFAVLSLVTIGLGIMSRIMPEMNIFMVGFPLKIFVGFYTLIFTIQHFPIILQRAFIEYNNLAEMLIRHLAIA